jgi:exonuclease SbcC
VTATAEGHQARLAATGHADDDLDARWAEVQAELAELRQVAATLAGCTATLEQLDAAQASAEAARAQLENDLAAAGRRATEAERRASAHSDRLQAALDGAADLGAALAACEALAAACDGARTAAAQAAAASVEALRSACAAEAACTAAGFPHVAAARAALRPAAWRERADRRCRAHDDERAAVEAVLAEPELLDLSREPADVTGATAAVQAADARLREASGAEAAAVARLRQVETLVPALVAAQEALVPLEERAEHVRRMADLCTGGGANALKMTLTSFVLAARLEEVAAVASGRLLRMTQGRYSLVHTDGAVKGGARSGLGLLARDSWTGQDRDTSTLSGGETFLASLALALGLADVVQAEAAGPGSRRCSSTRASGRWTSRPSTR